MLRFTVRFDRLTSDNDDDCIACDNFPHIADPERRLLEQFKAELTENKRMVGVFDIYRSQKINENLFCVWVGFEWNQNGILFMRELQDTFDTFGMSGFYEVLDVAGDGVDRVTNRDLVRKWLAKAGKPREGKRMKRPILWRIAGRLSGMHKDDLTTAERQIVTLLVDNGNLIIDDQGNVRDQDDIKPEN